MAIKSKLDRLAARIDAGERSHDADRLLVDLLGRRDALYWPWRDSGDHRGAVAELQDAYLSGRQGVRAAADGRDAWKATHHTRNELIASGDVTATRSGGQVTGLFVTPSGESNAKAIIGNMPTPTDAELLLARLQSCSGFEYLGRRWVSESELFNRELVGNPEGWEGQTELTLPMLTSGAAIANSDAHGRAYYSGNDAELPEIPTSTRTAAPWAHSAYIQSFDSERVRLHRLDAAGGRLVVAIPVTR